MKTTIMIVTLLLALPATQALCIEDTPANRTAQAERYINAAPPTDILTDFSEKIAAQLPPEQRESFKALLSKALDVKALTNVMSAALVKHFTAEELSALADFYSTPPAKSAMKKLGSYMAEVMPYMQKELTEAIQKSGLFIQEPKPTR